MVPKVCLSIPDHPSPTLAAVADDVQTIDAQRTQIALTLEVLGDSHKK
jgi:hypothetical protein